GLSAAPSQHALVGDAVTLSVRPLTSVPTDLSTFEAWALVTPPSGPVSNVTLTFAGGLFAGTYTPSTSGVYPVEFSVRNPANGDLANAPFGFAANPVDISPFSYVTNEDPRGAIFTAPVAYSRSVGEVHVILRSSQGDLGDRSEEHTSELQSRSDLVCRLLLEKKKKI